MFKNRWLRISLISALVVVVLAGAGLYTLRGRIPVNIAFAEGSGAITDITLPPGFSINFYAQGLPGARTMIRTENDTLFVSTRGQGSIYAIPNASAAAQAQDAVIVASGLNSPNGIEMIDGSLFVAEIGRVLRYDDIEANLQSPPEPVVVTDILPEEAHHGWRYMAQGPDDRLYIAVGAPCNVCELTVFFGTISRMNLDGSEFEVYATGVRNSVGFDWHPETGDLWFTNNGRDWMGDDLPPDTLHHAPQAGMHFGFPFCHAGDIPDPDFGSRRDCSEFTPPDAKLTPHGAALGMEFYEGEMFPAEYTHQIFIAERGSWNRTVPIGYRVMLARLDEAGNVLSYEPFAEGWLNANGEAWGRPVDIEMLADGSMLVSDDASGTIYRISYTG
ncbi:MAG: PQQ-dependent sugar dehydrogenase [Chloroflexota bacterium]